MNFVPKPYRPKSLLPIRQTVNRAWCPENVLHIQKDDIGNTSDVVVTLVGCAGYRGMHRDTE